MKPPPWRSPDKQDQVALTRFVLCELDRLDREGVRSASEDQIKWLKEAVEVHSQAHALGLEITGPRVTPEDTNDFERAVADVPKIRSLFRLHWGKRNRTMPPLAEEIAAARWELTPQQTARLIDKFQRKTAVSQR